MIAAQQLAAVFRAEQQQALAAAGEQTLLAQEAQVQADHYAALAEDPPEAFRETLFAYDLAGHLIGEYLADGTALREYVWLEDQPLALQVPGGVFGGASALYYHVDQLNTPQRLTDGSGRVVWDALMQPFGEVEVLTAEVEQNLRFPGQQYDAESGLHYNYFRDYDPVLGRYMEADPIGIYGGLNVFAYAEQGPVLVADPFGLAVTCEYKGIEFGPQYIDVSKEREFLWSIKVDGPGPRQPQPTDCMPMPPLPGMPPSFPCDIPTQPWSYQLSAWLLTTREVTKVNTTAVYHCTDDCTGEVEVRRQDNGPLVVAVSESSQTKFQWNGSGSPYQ